MLRQSMVGIVVLAAVGVACDSISGSGESEVVGIVEEFDADSPGVVLPQAVEAQEEFTITVYTTWPNGCAQVSRTEVEERNGSATVTPYDIVHEHGTCAQAPSRLTHEAVLSVSQAGTITVVVRGRASQDAAVAEREFVIAVE